MIMIMINTCFVFSLSCKKKMIKRKKIQTSIEIVDVPPPAYIETEEGPVSAGTTQLSKEELYDLEI